MIITIDGPAGVGKTTVGKSTAKKLDFGFLDTGIMYRALTWFVLKNKLENESQRKIINQIKNINFDLDIRNLINTTILLDKVDVTKLLNTPKVEQNVSKLSSYKEIRKIIDEAYKGARSIIKKNINQLHKLAKGLLQHETLTGEEIKDVIKGKKIKKTTTENTKNKNKTLSPVPTVEKRKKDVGLSKPQVENN